MDDSKRVLMLLAAALVMAVAPISDALGVDEVDVVFIVDTSCSMDSQWQSYSSLPNETGARYRMERARTQYSQDTPRLRGPARDGVQSVRFGSRMRFQAAGSRLAGTDPSDEPWQEDAILALDIRARKQIGVPYEPLGLYGEEFPVETAQLAVAALSDGLTNLLSGEPLLGDGGGAAGILASWNVVVKAKIRNGGYKSKFKVTGDMTVPMLDPAATDAWATLSNTVSLVETRAATFTAAFDQSWIDATGPGADDARILRATAIDELIAALSE